MIISFVEHDFQIDYLIKNNLINDKLLIIPLSVASYIYLKKKKINFENPNRFFNNESHEKCLNHSNSIMSVVYTHENKFAFKGVCDWFANGIRHSSLNYTIYIIEIISNVVLQLNPNEIIILSYNKEKSAGWSMSIYDDYITDILLLYCKQNKFNFKVLDINYKLKETSKNKSSFNKYFNFFNKINPSKEAAIFTSLNYNLYKIIKKIKNISNKCQIILLESNNLSFKKKLFLKIFYNIKFYNSYSDKLLKNDNLRNKYLQIINNFKNSMNYNNLKYWKIVEFKITNEIINNCIALEKESNYLENFIKKNNIKILFSPFSRGISYILGEISQKFSLRALCISHGTVVPYKNNLEKIENINIAKAVIYNDYPYVALQTKIAENFFKQNPSKSTLLKTGPIVFTNLNELKKNKKIKILHASTYKNKQNIKFWGVETPFEFLESLKDLINVFKNNNNYELCIKLHPSIKFECNQFEFIDILNLSDNIKFSSTSIERELIDTNILISFSSTTIEEAIVNKIPVILFDKWKRYNHYDSHDIDKLSFLPRPMYYSSDTQNIINNISKFL